MKYCSGCGKEVHETAVSCPNCGAVLNGGQVVQAVEWEKSRVAAALLAACLGGFGVHKFYLGKIFQGFLYLIFCWTFIPSIIAFAEFIIYITESDEKFSRRYR